MGRWREPSGTQGPPGRQVLALRRPPPPLSALGGSAPPRSTAGWQRRRGLPAVQEKVGRGEPSEVTSPGGWRQRQRRAKMSASQLAAASFHTRGGSSLKHRLLPCSGQPTLVSGIQACVESSTDVILTLGKHPKQS